MAPVAHVRGDGRAGLIDLHRQAARDQVRGGGEADRDRRRSRRREGCRARSWDGSLVRISSSGGFGGDGMAEAGDELGQRRAAWSRRARSEPLHGTAWISIRRQADIGRRRSSRSASDSSSRVLDRTEQVARAARKGRERNGIGVSYILISRDIGSSRQKKLRRPFSAAWQHIRHRRSTPRSGSPAGRSWPGSWPGRSGSSPAAPASPGRSG